MMTATRPLAPALALGLLIPLAASGRDTKRPEASKGPSAAPAAEPPWKPFDGLSFRPIGPFRGGRVCAVAGVRGDRLTYYFGGTGGGVWKTTDGGATWDPVSDKDFRTGSVGALAVAESDPNVVFAGMGEAPIRGNVSHGDGVWKSTDAGKTWRHAGLPNAFQISTVRIHPKDPDVVWAAVQGKVWGFSEERGVYKTTDGGKSWRKVLYVDERTGASDLALDATNPRVLYAGMWGVQRKPWELVSGGLSGGLFKSTDGGETWTKLTKGLPDSLVGKIGVAVSPANPQRVFALVEAEKGGLFRSDDGGESFTKVNETRELRQRAWYYTEVHADPRSPEVVYVQNVEFWRSKDGGKSFEKVSTPHGDNHDLWIDPDDPARMIGGDDGGAFVTVNGGRTWTSIENQPTAQLYRVATDDRSPYWIYGAQQDNSTVAIPSASRGSSISRNDWHDVGGCESGWIAPKPKDPDVVYAGCYGGSITRYDHRTGAEREIVAWPQLAIGQAPKDLKYRFQRNAPILVSRHDGALYHAAQVLLRSTDDGVTWTEVSPDLTRNDKTKQGSSGGPITLDNTGVEVYGTIFALAESPHEAGVLWAATDDGRVHVTRDGAATWKDVTPKAAPEWIQWNALDVSPHEKGAAYLAGTMYKWGDFRPYLFRTADFGATWTRIDAGIPEGSFTRVVREDDVKRGLLFAGTETGLYLSPDDGASWKPLRMNFPAVPVTDLAVKDDDLVVATQGRSFWVLDDLTPLREWTADVTARPSHLFAVRPVWRRVGPDLTEGPKGTLRSGVNPPNGALVTYWLKEAPRKDAPDSVKIEILEGETVLRTFMGPKKEDDTEKTEKKDGERKDDEPDEKPLEPKAGLNRFVWDLRMAKPGLIPKAVIWGSKSGPRVAPGAYSVRLTAAGRTATAPVEVRPNPNLRVSPKDLAAQADFLGKVRARISETHDAVARLRDVKLQAADLASRAKKLGKGEDLEKMSKELAARLTTIEETLVNPKHKAGQDVLNFPPRLDHELVGLASVVSSADAAPRTADLAFFSEVSKRLDATLKNLETLLATDLAAFNEAVRAAGVPPVAVLPTRKTPGR